MDKLKSVKGAAKEKWQDRPIHRDSLNKDNLKGHLTGKKKDPYEDARSHQSRPLGSLKDPDSFGAPPRHHDVQHNSPASPSTPTRPEAPSGGWGSTVPASTGKRQVQQEEEEEASKPPPGPYKVDTSGLRTDNLPKPPVRRADRPAPPAPPATPPRSGAVASPPPALPSRQPHQQQAPAPHLPPRMTEHPDEYTPPPPPTYNEATQPGQQDPATLNQGALDRLGQAGVSVPGFGIGQPAATNPSQAPIAPQGHTGQLSELQQRFARMGTNSPSQAYPAPSAPIVQSPAAAIAHKKPPPPPPPKKAGLVGSSDSRPTSSDAGSMPPPLPLSSKPRPPP